ncbi:uncharacterized protein LOC117226372 isoform X2 [Megalopta genalis]|uniref:uncharacterized protein LOC117226372 isoform X2 n=1 Tax=Megalopta genalis TaxID=115081 RepID=UPI00144318FC|nr:uncharacterized protein LOC117226372 isoform X2 [Megalopta genalis]
MATLFESSFLSSRLHRIEERYEEPANTFGKCDSISYRYLFLSVFLFAIGTAITTLGDLGEKWFIGPMFICSGFMVAVKCMLYLRRKSVIQMISRQRQLFMHRIHESTGTRVMEPISSTTSGLEGGLPSYEVVVQEVPELPPPSYAEALEVISNKTLVNDAKSSRGTISDGNVAVTENTREKP